MKHLKTSISFYTYASGVILFFSGMLIGYLIGHSSEQLEQIQLLHNSSNTTFTNDAKLKNTPSKEVTFQFHSLLTQSNTEKNTINHTKESPSPNNRTKNEQTTGFFIQVASFKNISKAQKLIHDLAHLPYNFQIEKKELGSGDIWHRVLIGPLYNEKEANRVKSQIKKNFLE